MIDGEQPPGADSESAPAAWGTPAPPMPLFCKHSLNFLPFVFYFVYIYVIINSNPHAPSMAGPKPRKAVVR